MTSTTAGPVRQTKGGQFIDAATLIALLFITLFVTTFVFAQEDEAPPPAETTSVAQPVISPAEQQQFDLMKAQGMVDDETVAALTTANAPSDNKYTIEWVPLRDDRVGRGVPGVRLFHVFSRVPRGHRSQIWIEILTG